MNITVTDSLQARAITSGVIVMAPSSASLSIGAIVGIAIGATILVAAAVLAIYIIHRKWTSGNFHKPLDREDAGGLYYKF